MAQYDCKHCGCLDLNIERITSKQSDKNVLTSIDVLCAGCGRRFSFNELVTIELNLKGIKDSIVGMEFAMQELSDAMYKVEQEYIESE